LDKLFHELGLGTRTQVQTIIRAGRVVVDGLPSSDPCLLVDPNQTQITLDGMPVHYQAIHILMMNKPTGVLTAAKDARQSTVMDLLPPLYHANRCMPVGRLDKDTEGLLLFTNDGALAHRILHPKHGMEKTYRVQLHTSVDSDDVTAFAEGLSLNDFTARSASLKPDPNDPTCAEVIVQEGKFHQIKRMFAARGLHVIGLRRIAIGPIHMDPMLAPGQYRSLTSDEESALRNA